MLEKAKTLAYFKWEKTLRFLRKHPKCETYGNGETVDSIWNKLPKTSKDYWLEKAENETYSGHRMYTANSSSNR